MVNTVSSGRTGLCLRKAKGTLTILICDDDGCDANISVVVNNGG